MVNLVADPLETAFDIRWESGRAIGVIEARGEIDLAAVPALKNALIEATGAEDGMVIDLSRVTYMDSSGFSTLLEANRALRPLGMRLFLTGANPIILRMLEITRLDSIFSVETNVESAINAIRRNAVAV